MIKHLFLFFTGFCTILVLTACSGSTSASTSLNVTMTEFAFSPNTFTIPAGKQISITIRNNGAVVHSFIIMKSGYSVSGHYTDADKPNIFWEEPQIAPGQSVTDKFTSPEEPGEYQIICGIPGHLESGMIAKLTVITQP
jgi:uncharacterized cupredoxin-like copper-binding protein